MLQHKIYDKPHLRMIVEAMLYRMRVGCPWRDLPADFGFWNSIYQPFNRWSSKNKIIQIFKVLVQEPDLEWTFIDGSIVKAHQHIEKNYPFQSFQERTILKLAMQIWIGVFISTGI